MLRSHKVSCSQKSLGWQRSGFLRSEVSAVDFSTLFREMVFEPFLVHCFWNLHSHHQQKQPRKGPGLLLTTLATRGIITNSKCEVCSSYKCVEIDWHLGNFRLFLNWEADKQTRCLFTTCFLWLFSLQTLGRVLFTFCQWYSFLIKLLS